MHEETVSQCIIMVYYNYTFMLQMSINKSIELREILSPRPVESSLIEIIFNFKTIAVYVCPLKSYMISFGKIFA